MKRFRSILSACLLLTFLFSLIPIAQASPASGTLTLTGPSTMVAGAKSALSVSMSDGSALPGDVVFASNKKAVVKVNKTTGEVTAVKAGTAKITVSSKTLKKAANATLTITVKKNVYNGATANYYNYQSTKKLSYSKNVLIAELSMYNGPAYSQPKKWKYIKNTDNTPFGVMLCKGTNQMVVGALTCYKATFKKAVGPNKAGSLIFKFPLDKINGKAILDLTSDVYSIEFLHNGKLSIYGTGRKGAVSDATAFIAPVN